MTASKALFGLKPLRKRGSNTNSRGFSTYSIDSAYAANIFKGDVVHLNATGKIEVMLSTSVRAIGVFEGCQYEADGVPKWSKYWPSGTSASNIKAYVDDDPNTTFLIQADASVTVGDINAQNFGVTLGAGSSFTGQSGMGLDAGSRSNGSLLLRVIGNYDEPGNDITVAAQRAFPKVEVRFVEHADNYADIGVSVSA
jgi:hypothetical protein